MSENPRIEELKRRVQSDPASIAFAALAEEFRRSGRFEEAIATCTAGLVRHPAYLSAHVTLGRALIEVGRYEDAREELRARPQACARKPRGDPRAGRDPSPSRRRRARRVHRRRRRTICGGGRRGAGSRSASRRTGRRPGDRVPSSARGRACRRPRRDTCNRSGSRAGHGVGGDARRPRPPRRRRPGARRARTVPRGHHPCAHRARRTLRRVNLQLPTPNSQAAGGEVGASFTQTVRSILFGSWQLTVGRLGSLGVGRLGVGSWGSGHES